MIDNGTRIQCRIMAVKEIDNTDSCKSPKAPKAQVIHQ